MSLTKWIPASVLGGVGYTQQETIGTIAESPIEIVQIVRTQVELSSIQRLVLIDVIDNSFKPKNFREYLRARLLSNSDRDVSLDPWGNPYSIRIYKNEYEIWSYGPDQINDTSDDLWVSLPMG